MEEGESKRNRKQEKPTPQEKSEKKTTAVRNQGPLSPTQFGLHVKKFIGKNDFFFLKTKIFLKLICNAYIFLEKGPIYGSMYIFFEKGNPERIHPNVPRLLPRA